MKAIQYNTYGGSEVLAESDIAEPAAKQGQVLVEVKAAGFNPFDLKLRAGMMKDFIPLTFPVVFGGDVAGVVTAVGDGVKEYVVGDEVYGTAMILGGGSGSFAQRAAVNAANVAKKPKNTNFEEAAALPLVGASSVQALEDHMHLGKGQKVLIHGGAGGIGHVAIQIAKAIGAHVITTVNTDDVDFVKKLGADEVIDYKTQKFEEVVRDVDGVFDMVGGETLAKSFVVLKKGGVLVTMMGKPDAALAQEYGVIAIGQGTKTDNAHLSRVAWYVDSMNVRVHVGGAFPMGDVQKASTLAEGHVRGKVVLVIK
jgi:alcohol dehydrogenase